MGNLDLLDSGRRIATEFIPFLFALCFHEFAHGWVARLRGDRTAEMMGRLTLNPLAHMDPIGTFLLPLSAILFHWPFSFGWARPVPVNARNFKNIRTDMFWVALAGPLSNILLALVAAFGFAFSMRFMQDSVYFPAVRGIIYAFIGSNLILAVFNMLPLYPLDGARVLARFLPASINHRLEQNEFGSSMILLFLIMTGALQFLIVPVQFLANAFLTMAIRIVL